MNPLHRLVQDKRIIVCVGSGGVGKTTVAASIALKAAALGKKVMVCTIDPARRLANSLGMTELGNTETRVSDEKFREAGVEPKGELYAMMLDLKRTWDDLIVKHAPADRREAILASRFYQQLSSALAGSQEYVAMEKLYDLHHERDYDLIVLDTPPTAHALDFLDAPNRVLDFFGNDAMRWLLTPALKAGRAGLKMFNLAGGYFVKTISRVTGTDLLQELAEFLVSLAPLYDHFKERASAVKALLGSEKAAFVLVSSPNPLTVDEAIYFHQLLLENQMPLGAVVANRVNVAAALPVPPAQVDALHVALAAAGAELGVPLRQRLESAIAEARVLAEVDADQLQRLAAQCAPTPLVRVPRFGSDVHDLSGLWSLDQHLFADS
ncbi:MAG: ArsA family ATPase [Myxococcales bacterium]